MSSLHLKTLVITRMPGIQQRFELSGLASGINVIFGPNGSGKTTTSRAIEALLWPPHFAPETASVESRFEVSGEEWWAEIDAGRARFQKDGRPSGSPNALPGEARDRYLLPLHDLLTVEDTGLARAIALESVGGYDLDLAAKSLSPRTSLSRPKREQEDLRSARERLQNARAVQERLQLEAAALRDDEQRLAKRPEVEQRLAYLRLMVEHHQRAAELAVAAERLSRFHPAIERIAVDDDKRLRSLRVKLAEAEEGASRAAEQLRAAGRDLSRSGISEEVAASPEIAALSRELAEADAIDSEIRREDREVQAAQIAVAEVAQRLGGFIDTGAAASIGPAEISQLRPDLETIQKLGAEITKIEAELALLQSEGAALDRPRLERGAYLLQQWLRATFVEDSSPRRAGQLAGAGASLLVVAGIALAFVTPLSLILSAAGALLFLLLLRLQSPTDLRPHHQKDFSDLRIEPSPEAWETDSVRACLDELHRQIAAAHASEHSSARAERLERQLSGARAQEAELRLRADQVCRELGLEATAEIDLIYLLDRIIKLQDARTTLERANAARIQSWSHRSEVLSRANQRLQRIEQEPVGDLVSLRARVGSLVENLQSYRRAETLLSEAQRELQLQQGRTKELRDEIDSLCSRLEVPDVDDRTISNWCAQRDDMLRCRSVFDGLHAERQRLESSLRSCSEFEEDALDPDVQEVLNEIQKLEDELGALADLRDRVVTLRSEIERATRGHDVEDALAELERCADALREIRDRDARATLANILVAHVERESRNQHRPEVFHRASRLFSQITRGRYDLRLEEGADPSFRAYDNERGRSQSLDELSSGTRVQLLLAVRVAFVEVQEGGLQLPLLLDETLANSDDDRSAAIIEAILTLAANGRQLFYFTAQPEEVRKWQTAIAASPHIQASLIDLAAIRRLEGSLDFSRLEPVEVLPQVPPPGALSHFDYGRLLQVAKLDPLAPAESLHLWYLVEDPDTLHAVLSTVRAETVGSVRSLIDHGGGSTLPGDLLARLEALVATASSALRRLRIGMGKPVDRHALVCSGAVSEVFLDEIAELCQRLNGDAALVLQSIENREVARFPRRKAEALEEFLESEGYLDRRSRLRAEQIRMEVLGEVSAYIDSKVLMLDEVDRLLARLGVPLSRFSDAEKQELELWPGD